MAITPVTVTRQVTLDGEDITDKVKQIEINNSATSLYKTVTIYLNDKDIVYTKRPYLRKDANFGDTRITITVNSICMGNFLWEATDFETKIPGVEATMRGRSATALLDLPYSTPITTIYNEVTSKKALVETLCSSFTVVWPNEDSDGIPDNPLPASRFGVSSKTPIQVIQGLIGASHGVIVTNENDDIVVKYKTFNVEGKASSATLDGEVEIYGLTESHEVPEGYNAIRIQSYESGTYMVNFPVVRLTLSNSKLIANGADYLMATATCYDPDGMVAVVNLYEDELQTATSWHKISTSNAITEVHSICRINDSNDCVEAISFETPDVGETEIITTDSSTMFAIYNYFITYKGGRRCGFSYTTTYGISVDVCSPAPIVGMESDGIAQTKVRAGEGGGGIIVMKANYRGEEAEKLFTVGHPDVRDITVRCDPSNIGYESQCGVYARVIMPSGNPIYDGFEVNFSLNGQAGTLSSATATTGSTLITEEVWSSSARRISLSDVPSSLVGLWAGDSTKTGSEYTSAVDTLNNQTIVLTEEAAFEFPRNKFYAEFLTGGYAQVKYTSPNVKPNGWELRQEVDIEGIAGGRNNWGIVYVSTGSKSSKRSGSGYGDNAENNEEETDSEYENIVWEDSGVHADYSYEDKDFKRVFYLEPRNSPIKIVSHYEKSCTLWFDGNASSQTQGSMRVTLRVPGMFTYPSENENTYRPYNKLYEEFSLKVKVIDADTEAPIGGAIVAIDWPTADGGTDTEIQVTEEMSVTTSIDVVGIATFARARPTAAPLSVAADGYYDFSSNIDGTQFAPSDVLNRLHNPPKATSAAAAAAGLSQPKRIEWYARIVYRTYGGAIW